jgi:hypothetical protein
MHARVPKHNPRTTFHTVSEGEFCELRHNGVLRSSLPASHAQSTPKQSDFAALTARALAMAGQVGGVHGALLEMLTDCYPLARLAHERERGASYKRLAAAGHMVGMTMSERSRWYRVAEAIPLADRHLGHILSRLRESAA